jgi:ABC-type dipeptide/oligopeptide/nickel transport system permease component
MTGYILRRILASLPTLVVVMALTFFLLRAIPGDPAEARAASLEGYSIDRAAMESLRQQYGLTRSLGEQAIDWAGRCLRFDFGNSYGDGMPVAPKLARALWTTAFLNLAAVGLLVGCSLTTGIWLAARAGSAFDLWIGRALAALAAVPVAWGSILVQRFFAADLGWFPLQGSGPAGLSAGGGLPLPRLEYLCLPALAIAYRGIALYSRLVRQALVQTLQAGYLTAARARGLPTALLFLRHALRNAALPLISVGATLVPVLISGNVVVENVFGWPGAGRLAVEALIGRDYPVLLALTWVSALFVLTGLLAADLIVGLADPRVRVGEPVETPI